MSAPDDLTPARDDQATDPAAEIVVPDPQIRTITLVRGGMLCWAIALVVLLSGPALRADGRGWWLWVPVAGLALGALGLAYLARGRGNAALA